MGQDRLDIRFSNLYNEMIVYPFRKTSMAPKYLLVLFDSKGKNVMKNVLSLKITKTLKKNPGNFTITIPG